jgi:HK97 family phage portal protein
MSILTRVRAAFKSFMVSYDTTSVWYGRYSSGFYGGDIDYNAEAGDLGLNSIVMACINWIADNFAGAPVIVTAPKGDDREPVKGHLLTQLLESPNPYYSGALLWKPTLYSYHVAGNAYWQKVRSNIGAVVALYYLPHTIVRAVSQEGEFISYYEIWDGTRWNAIPREDIVHFRNGLKVGDRRYGTGDLDSVLREVFTDNEAARFSANILRNMGIPGGIISSSDSDNPITDAPAIKAAFMNATTGDRRGEVIVVTTPLKYDPPTTNPKDINVDEFRKKAEERIPAVLGLHPAVPGLGAGLDRCLPAGARVWTIAGAERIADIRPGRVVWSFVDGRLEPRRVTVQRKTGNKPLFEIRTKNRVLRATDNHPLLVRVPGNSKGHNSERSAGYEWRRVDQLQVGDHIVEARSLPDQGVSTLPDGTPATVDLMQFLGVIVGDGTVREGVGVRIAMPPADRCVDHYRTLASQLFTKQASQSGGNLAVQVGVPRAPIVLQERERDFGFASAAASRQLAMWGFAGRATTKRVPSWVYSLTVDLRRAFIAGLVDSDGYIDARGMLTFSFANQQLTHDVRDLLISVGVPCSNVGERVMLSTVLPNKGKQEQYWAWTFTASCPREIARIPTVDPLYRARLDTWGDAGRTEGFDAHKAGLCEHLGFYEIKSIRELPAEDVYDIEVEGGHSFIADGVIVHNSTYSNMEEAFRAAWRNNLIPTQTVLAAELTTQLLPDLGRPNERVEFDYSDVEALQESRNDQVTRAVAAYNAGLVKRSEARQWLGLQSDPDDEQYKSSPAPVLPPPMEIDPMALPEPVKALGMLLNGNGHR